MRLVITRARPRLQSSPIPPSNSFNSSSPSLGLDMSLSLTPKAFVRIPNFDVFSAPSESYSQTKVLSTRKRGSPSWAKKSTKIPDFPISHSDLRIGCKLNKHIITTSLSTGILSCYAAPFTAQYLLYCFLVVRFLRF